MTTTTADPAYLRAMPKVELHCHLEGSVPARTAIALARRNGMPLPTSDPDLLYRFDDLEGFLDLYRGVSQTMVCARDFAEVTYDSLIEAADSSNLRYREIAFNPTNHPGLALADMLAGISDGITAAGHDRGIRARIIVAINREHPAHTAVDLVRDVVAADHPLVVGVGLDHNELLGPPQRFAGAFALAEAAGLARTAHAGERGDPAEVADSIESLNLQRVDHGYAVLADPDLIARSIGRSIHYAACWSTSAFHAGAAGSPIPAMLAAGLDVSISSDDPPFFDTDIGAEYARAGTAAQWTREQARSQVLMAARAAFLPAAEKGELLADLADQFAAFDEGPRPITGASTVAAAPTAGP